MNDSLYLIEITYDVSHVVIMGVIGVWRNILDLWRVCVCVCLCVCVFVCLCVCVCVCVCVQLVGLRTTVQ